MRASEMALSCAQVAGLYHAIAITPSASDTLMAAPHRHRARLGFEKVSASHHADDAASRRPRTAGEGNSNNVDRLQDQQQKPRRPSRTGPRALPIRWSTQQHGG